jgi:hypothetical protein
MAYLTQSLNDVVSNEFFRNPIYPGIADAIQEAQTFYEFVPFTAIKGSSIGVNENTDQNLTAFVADGADLDTGNPINQLTTGVRNYNIKSIAGLANIGTVSNAGATANGVDLMAVAVQAKARDIARKIYKQVVLGTVGGDASGFTGFNDFYATGGGLDGKNELYLSGGATPNIADALDELLNSLTAADPDFIMMNGTMLNKFTARMRALGAGYNYVTSPITNRNILSYQGVPIFRNDHLPVHSTSQHDIYAGCFEQGGNTGITMIYPEGTPAGLEVVDLGESEKYLGRVTRVAQHSAIAVMNSEGLARMTVDTAVNTGL